MKPNSSVPIFIVGTQRSGTTLLGRMLAAHPDLFIRNESSKVINALRMKKNKEEIIRILCGEIQGNAEADIETILKEKGKRRWGFKDPGLTDFLDDLWANFNGAKFVIIVRDGRAVAISKIKARYGTANIYYAAQKWVEEINLQKKFYMEHRENCLTVKYEALVENPERELKQISEFLEEPYVEKMLRYYEEDDYIDEKNKYNLNTFKKLDPAITSKWKTELSPSQINVFESVAGDVLEANGYELIGQKMRISVARRWCYMIHQKIVSEIQLQYKWRILPKLKKINTKPA
jgi:hypothetical protein